MIPDFFRPLLLSSWLLLSLTAVGQSQKKDSPSILLIYADDLGYGDIGCYGAKVATPHIDKLAANGIRFTNAHATAATCTPSRYSLLTFMYVTLWV